MKIKIEYDDKLKTDEVVIKVSEDNESVQSIVSSLKSNNSNCVAGKLNDKIYLVDIKDVECFFSYDGAVLFSANDLEYKLNEKLLELQMKYESRNFIRISKSVIVNLKKIEYLAPEFNRKLMFKMESGKVEYSSRTYYAKIKEKLGV